MSQPSNWIIAFAALSSLGALLNAFTAIINRYDARIKTIRDLLEARAESINRNVSNNVINTNDQFIMAPICKKALQVENDINEARKILIVRVFSFIFRSDIQKELRIYFYTSLHSSLQDFFSEGDGKADSNLVNGQVIKIREIYKEF